MSLGSIVRIGAMTLFFYSLISFLLTAYDVYIVVPAAGKGVSMGDRDSFGDQTGERVGSRVEAPPGSDGQEHADVPPDAPAVESTGDSVVDILMGAVEAERAEKWRDAVTSYENAAVEAVRRVEASMAGAPGEVSEVSEAASAASDGANIDPIIALLPEIHAGRAFALSQIGRYKDAVSAASESIRLSRAMATSAPTSSAAAAPEDSASDGSEEEDDDVDPSTRADVESYSAGSLTHIVPASVLVTRGMALDELGLTKTALRDYREALRIEPKNVVARERVELAESDGNVCAMKRKRAEKEKTLEGTRASEQSDGDGDEE